MVRSPIPTLSCRCTQKYTWQKKALCTLFNVTHKLLWQHMESTRRRPHERQWFALILRIIKPNDALHKKILTDCRLACCDVAHQNVGLYFVNCYVTARNAFLPVADSLTPGLHNSESSKCRIININLQRAAKDCDVWISL